MAKRVYLTKGKFTLVDDEAYEYLKQYKWCYNGYAVRQIQDPITKKRSRIAIHQMLFPLQDGLEPDHINRNKLDNRRCNLRLVSRSENTENRADRSAVCGIFAAGGKWKVYTTREGKRTCISTCNTIAEARQVVGEYISAECKNRKQHG